MRKITLSAALLAAAVMGCSDASQDNSVVSTSDTQNKMDLSFLKYEPTEFKDVTASEKSLELCKSGDEFSDGSSFYDDNNKYKINISSWVDHADGKYKGGGSMTIFMRKTNPLANGILCINDTDEWCWYYGANYIHMYVACVRDCDGFGNCRYHDMKPFHKAVHNHGLSRADVDVTCNIKSDNNDIGVVTYGAAVFENGTLPIQGATRKNLSNDMALLVYRNYILPQQLADAGL